MARTRSGVFEALAPTALAAAASRRGLAYWLLARCFDEVPQRALLEELSAAMGPAAVEMPFGEYTFALTEEALRAVLATAGWEEDLAVEFTRLFGGFSKSNGLPPPFESVAREGRWGGETVPDILAAYAEADIEPPLAEGEPADHLAAELRFLAIACYRESEAWNKGDTEAAMVLLRREEDFLDRHLLKWVTAYCAQALEKAQTPFYRALLVATPCACTRDREDISVIREEAASARAYA